jgi:hypothetical protein
VFSAPDDRTAAYVIAVHPCFDDLRQVAAQLAGLLVLAATESKDSSPDHPMLSAARQVLAKATDGVKRVAVPAGDRARLHHHELIESAAALEQAIARADAWPLDVDVVLSPLRAAYTHLQRAAAALPGFSIVSFEQACCGRSNGNDIHRKAR